MSGSLARTLLLPLTPLYRLALAGRELRLQRGWQPARRLKFPVISIGNLSTGGAGKTPLAITLAKALAARGYRIDVLSRGYGRKTREPAQVDPAGAAEDFGDEPLLIARDARIPVYVAAERYQAGLLAEGTPSFPSPQARNLPCPILAPFSWRKGGRPRTLTVPTSRGNRILGRAENTPHLSRALAPEGRFLHILDDGFQHRQLHRDVNILLLNLEDFRDRLLPAGNLREPLSAIHRANVIAIPENEPEVETELRTYGWKGPVWRLRRHMDVPRVDGPLVAFCGIARPEQFFAGLESAGLRLAGRVALRDHHRYTPADLQRLQLAARSSGAIALITTAKDEVRLAPPTKSVSSGLPILTAGLKIEICDQEVALDWLERRLADTAARPSL